MASSFPRFQLYEEDFPKQSEQEGRAPEDILAQTFIFRKSPYGQGMGLYIRDELNVH
jgi:hypothetical protein